MTDWITTLYDRYVQLFGDPDAPVSARTAGAQPPTEQPVTQAAKQRAS